MNPDAASNIGAWVAGGLSGTGLVVYLIRAYITWANRQGLITTGDNSQKDLLESLRAEAKKWEDKYEAEVKDHEATKSLYESNLILYGELRVQNKMLRMLLIQRGMSAEELNDALQIDTKDDPAHN